MRIGIAQVNSTLGDFKNNASKIIEYVIRAKQLNCELVVFPESVLFGYHPFDLLERKQSVHIQEKFLKQLLNKIPKGIAVIVGVITENDSRIGRPYFNSAVLFEKNRIIKKFNKQILPTGDVFDEARYIESGDLTKNFFDYNGKKFFLTICEDIWAWPDERGYSPHSFNPLKKIKGKVDLVINLSASPYYQGKMKLREYMAYQTAKHFKAPIMYVNLIGAQDEIVFDGGSFVIDPSGKKQMACKQFVEEFNFIELENDQKRILPTKINVNEEIRKALVLGIKDFAEKIGISKAHLGISGGIDSAVVACLAVEALGAKNVTAIALPGPFNSQESLLSAKELCQNLGIQFYELSITKPYEACVKQIQKSFKHSEFDLVNENLQARIRGLMLMAYSNKMGSLLLNTSNKSEFAAGYSTLYGDLCGGLCVIGDLKKNQVYSLAKNYNKNKKIIPDFIIDRPPSAELRPNQKDQDSLPPYDILDATVVSLVEKGAGAKSDVQKWLINSLYKSEFKRWQAPPILKVTERAFGRGRRLPIAHKVKN